MDKIKRHELEARRTETAADREAVVQNDWALREEKRTHDRAAEVEAGPPAEKPRIRLDSEVPVHIIQIRIPEPNAEDIGKIAMWIIRVWWAVFTRLIAWILVAVVVAVVVTFVVIGLLSS